MSAFFVMTADLMECPACHKQLSARMQYSVDPTEGLQAQKSQTFEATLEGIAVSHDCTKGQTR